MGDPAILTQSKALCRDDGEVVQQTELTATPDGRKDGHSLAILKEHQGFVSRGKTPSVYNFCVFEHPKCHLRAARAPGE